MLTYEYDETDHTVSVYAGDTLVVRLATRDGTVDLAEVRRALDATYGAAIDRPRRRWRDRLEDVA